MLLGFIGAPCSGKSTIATKMFTTLKENGDKTELITEQARQYIAKLRYFNHKKGLSTDITLTDEDQVAIYSKQKEIEEAMKFSCGKDTVIVSDSSVFNTSLYMSNDFLDKTDSSFFRNLKNHYDMIFFCHPIHLNVLPQDPNRIHDLESVNKLADKSLKLLSIVKSLGIHTHELLGSLSLDQRYKDTCSAAMEQYLVLANKF